MRLPKPEIGREDAMKLWISEHSDYAKEQVVLNNIGIIGIVLKAINLNMFDEDLFSVGLIGLIKAVNAFNPDKGYAFSTYAKSVIENEILMTYRKKRIVPAFSIDKPYSINDGEEVFYAEILADNRRFEEESIFGMQFSEMLNSLNKREKRIIFLKIKGNTQSEIGEKIGTTQTQVSRIIKNIYKKWRKANGL